MERDMPDASNPRGRPSAKFGRLSLLCLLGGCGLGFCFFFVGVGIGGRVGQFVGLVATELVLMAWLIGLVFGVRGVWRGERPLWPAVLGLLPVVGVIVLWFEPLFQTHARGKRPRAQCLSNEKQILLAMAMYADANGGRYPMDSINPTLVGSLQLLSNIAPTAAIFHCPEDRRPGARAERDYTKLTTLNISYSYVPNLKWQDTPDSPVILDRIYSTTNGSAWPSDGNHRGQGGIVGFNDGHAQWCNVLPADLKDENGRQVVLSP